MANGIFAVPGQSVAVIIKSSKVGGAFIFFSPIFCARRGRTSCLYIAYLYIRNSAKLLVEA